MCRKDSYMEDEKQKSRSSRRTTAQIVAEELSSLKKEIFKELKRGADLDGVCLKFNQSADRIIAEFRDYARLEHIIDEKSNAAVRRVDWRIGIVSVVVVVLSLFGWNILVEKATTAAISKIGEEEAKNEIRRVVSNQVDRATIAKIEERVPGLINERVPDMIRKGIASTQMRLKSELEACVAERISQVNGKADGANDAIQRVSEKVETMSIVYAARAGERKDFDRLRLLAGQTNDTGKIARDGVRAIEEEFKQRKNRFGDDGIHLQKSELGFRIDELVDLCRADLDWNCSGAVGELVRLKRKEFVSTIVGVIEKSKRIETVYYAILGLEKLTGRKFDPLGINQVLEWWKGNRDKTEYHSPYELYCELAEQMRTALQDTTGVKAREMIATLQDKLERDGKNPAVSKVIAYLITLFPDAGQRYKEGRAELCLKALNDLEGTEFKDSQWYLFKAYYVLYNKPIDEFYAYVNTRLKEYPKFEIELKKSGMFSDTFFEIKEVDWPSKKPVQKRLEKSPPDVRTFPLAGMKVVAREEPKNGGCNSENGVGYVVVKIEKGKRVLTELSAGKQRVLPREKLGEKKTGVLVGDAISWTDNGKDVRYEFNGTVWKTKEGENADEVGIPVGECSITYERVLDKKTELSFSVEF